MHGGRQGQGSVQVSPVTPSGVVDAIQAWQQVWGSFGTIPDWAPRLRGYHDFTSSELKEKCHQKENAK